jgi:hypothetical protein
MTLIYRVRLFEALVSAMVPPARINADSPDFVASRKSPAQRPGLKSMVGEPWTEDLGPHSDVVRAASALTVSWHDLQWWVVLIVAGGCALYLAWLWLTGKLSK